ncbi:hypothetical protein [Phycisphaera mikurensis]|uniref:Response regulatory domain-containing protein n=1 Tax=Phycisphaera mikurensis (strain NBRC 102666 / KCTC 22515 / FYK2301M01) TaxID=1142394 RepID=I0IAK1_PHYMF|nr:hypothetical protein [Phycisphaera mikurensis]MBB6441715.1 hypothetical protein [Phycisphaera mikurensis]BAM02289.1 hypothetical protein PSMK_01300 [Phycisphaera mikurensis NBRC 102666]
MPENHPHETPTVLLVGHCGFDSGGLTAAAKAALPGATVERVNTQDALAAKRGPGVVLLVNRVLDGRFDATDGVQLIEQEARRDGGTRALLVSNYAESQARAEAAGGRRGFGKDDVGTDVATARIREAAAG